MKQQTNLQQQSITSFLLDSLLNPQRISNQQIIPYNLDCSFFIVRSPSVEIVLIEWIFNGTDIVLVTEGEVVVGQLFAGEVFGCVRVGVLLLTVLALGCVVRERWMR